MQEMSVFWLRAATALYAIGLLHTIQIATRKQSSLFRPALAAFCVGVILHMVALVEAAHVANHFPPEGFYQALSLWGFVFAVSFLFLHWKYRFESLGVFLFPMVFIMTAAASMQSPVGSWSNQTARSAWLMLHIILVLLGYAALVLTALASVFYLIQERHLKRKTSMTLLETLPPLGTLDGLITSSLGIGFVLLTAGLITGASWAFIELGTSWFDARFTTALITWAACLLMVVLRVSAGWRGRKAAVMAVTVVAASAASWAVHYVRQ